MPEKLKPCPACGTPGDTLEVYPVKDGFYQVGCWDCFMRGTRLLSPDKAIKAWNALPRRLRWSKEPPKEPGWYWVRDYGKRIHIVDVGCDMTEYEPQPYREWAGPIPEPEEKYHD
jgi:hypothetical protein